MNLFFACCVVASAAVIGGNAPALGATMSSLLPTDVDGWKGDGMDATYGPDDLYNYINGGAEVYVALNFKSVFARRYEKSGEPEIICDIFDMGSSRDAFGAYHHDMREGESAKVGNESERSDTSIAFWKGPYFVSIVAFDDTPGAQRAMATLAQHIAGQIPQAGMPPEMLKLLPEVGLQKSKLHFFHDHLTLHSHYLLARANVLGLGKRTDCLLARYGKALPDGQRQSWTLLVVNYPGTSAAEAGAKGLAEQVLTGADDRQSVQREDGRFGAYRVVGSTLIVTLDVPDRQIALDAVADVARRVVGW